MEEAGRVAGVTEDKAKTKWCPMVRSSRGPLGGTGSVNVIPGGDGAPMRDKCIASGCMMWRHHGMGHMNTGYCGLAGKD